MCTNSRGIILLTLIIALFILTIFTTPSVAASYDKVAEIANTAMSGSLRNENDPRDHLELAKLQKAGHQGSTTKMVGAEDIHHDDPEEETEDHQDNDHMFNNYRYLAQFTFGFDNFDDNYDLWSTVMDKLIIGLGPHCGFSSSPHSASSSYPPIPGMIEQSDVNLKLTKDVPEQNTFQKANERADKWKKERDHDITALPKAYSIHTVLPTYLAPIKKILKTSATPSLLSKKLFNNVKKVQPPSDQYELLFDNEQIKLDPVDHQQLLSKFSASCGSERINMIIKEINKEINKEQQDKINKQQEQSTGNAKALMNKLSLKKSIQITSYSLSFLLLDRRCIYLPPNSYHSKGNFGPTESIHQGLISIQGQKQGKTITTTEDINNPKALGGTTQNEMDDDEEYGYSLQCLPRNELNECTQSFECPHGSVCQQHFNQDLNDYGLYCSVVHTFERQFIPPSVLKWTFGILILSLCFYLLIVVLDRKGLIIYDHPEKNTNNFIRGYVYSYHFFMDVYNMYCPESIKKKINSIFYPDFDDDNVNNYNNDQDIYSIKSKKYDGDSEDIGNSLLQGQHGNRIISNNQHHPIHHSQQNQQPDIFIPPTSSYNSDIPSSNTANTYRQMRSILEEDDDEINHHYLPTSPSTISTAVTTRTGINSSRPYPSLPPSTATTNSNIMSSNNNNNGWKQQQQLSSQLPLNPSTNSLTNHYQYNNPFNTNIKSHSNNHDNGSKNDGNQMIDNLGNSSINNTNNNHMTNNPPFIPQQLSPNSHLRTTPIVPPPPSSSPDKIKGQVMNQNAQEKTFEEISKIPINNSPSTFSRMSNQQVITAQSVVNSNNQQGIQFPMQQPMQPQQHSHFSPPQHFSQPK